MTHRRALATLVVSIALTMSAVPARAQAWLPPQGEGTVSILFSDMLSNTHFFGTEPVDAGRIRSESMVLDVTYGVTDRIAFSAAIPLVASEYTGNSSSPFAVPHPQPLYPGVNPLDNGRYHTVLQDFRFSARYNLVKKRGFALTPFVGSIVPSHDYEIFAHAAAGRHLEELQFGVSAAKVFESVLPGVFVQANYSYGIVQHVLDISHNRSMLSAEAGYFVTPRVRVIGLSSGQITHGGIDASAGLCDGWRRRRLRDEREDRSVRLARACACGGAAQFPSDRPQRDGRVDVELLHAARKRSGDREHRRVAGPMRLRERHEVEPCGMSLRSWDGSWCYLPVRSSRRSMPPRPRRTPSGRSKRRRES
jgi:hypothetical protein